MKNAASEMSPKKKKKKRHKWKLGAVIVNVRLLYSRHNICLGQWLNWHFEHQGAPWQTPAPTQAHLHNNKSPSVRL